MAALNPPATHRDGPTLLDVLRICDTAEVLGMVAPRPLALVGADEALAKRVQAIFKAAGAEKSLTLK